MPRAPVSVVAAAAKACKPRPRLKPKATRSFVQLFKALGDDTRLEMMGLLAAEGDGELCVCEIEAHFKLSQPTVSHHLKLLRDAGLVRSERRGSWVYYAIDAAGLSKLEEFRALIAR